MRVLVTGGAGFIGAHVAAALQARGDHLTILDDFNGYYDPALKSARLAALLGNRPVVITADIRDEEQVTRVVEAAHPDAVIHLAAWAGVRPSREHASLFAAVNVQGTVNVLEACRRARVQRVVFASSSSVYGRSAAVPSPEDAPTDTPASGYGVSKRAGELYAHLAHTLDGLAVSCLRFFTVYGPWGRPDMAVWKFTEGILSGRPIILHERARDGREVRRAFTEVSDIVQGTIAALERQEPFLIVNLGAASPVSLRELVTAIEFATKKHAVIEERILPDEEAVETGADLRRAETILGFRPRVTVGEGVERFVRWYLSDYRRHFPSGLKRSRFWS